MNYLFIFLGGGLGSLCRYGIAQVLVPYKLDFPWATVLANFLACLVLGLFVGWSMKNKVSAPMAFFWMVGFCGGFSTFSTFTNETFQLMASGAMTKAFLNIGLSLVVCLISLYLGIRASASLI